MNTHISDSSIETYLEMAYEDMKNDKFTRFFAKN